DAKDKSAAHKRDTKVSVMTMHSSKGLEFDFVFVANCSETFKKADKRYDLLIDQDGFIGIKGFDSENKRKLPSLSIEGTINVLNHKEFAERIRLFYVAATRAKEYMFISGRNVKRDENSFMGIVLKHCTNVEIHNAETVQAK
ncbi:MAG: 3'-5' exonuclease, partial [Christensenellales bacterium]